MKTNKSGIRFLALALLGGLGCGDLQTGDGETLASYTVNASMGRNGVVSNGASSNPKMSPDGRYVVFTSKASNLAPDSNGSLDDVFIKDRATDSVKLVSIGNSGLPSGYAAVGSNVAVSADGNFIAFESADWQLDGGLTPDYTAGTVGIRWVLRRDLRAGGKTKIAARDQINTPGHEWGGAYNTSFNCALGGISRDGRWVVLSTQYDLVNGLAGNGRAQLYLADMLPTENFQKAKVYLISHRNGLSSAVYDGDGAPFPSPTGIAEESPGIAIAQSGGRICVAFVSNSNQLVSGNQNPGNVGQVYFWKSGPNLDNPTSGDACVLISKDNSGNVANGTCRTPSVSSDGTYIAYVAFANNLPGIALARVDTSSNPPSFQSVTPVFEGGDCYRPSVSDDGRFVAFSSDSNTLLTDYSQVLVRDMQQALTPVPGGLPLGLTLVSVSSVGAKGDLASTLPSLSADGRTVAFGSQATNLVVADNNGLSDIFVRGPSK